MKFPRDIYPLLEAELHTKEATVITGMRRVGKTTTLEHLYTLISSPNKVLFDLENPLHRKLFEDENYDAIWQHLKPFGISKDRKAYIFLDEVQNLPKVSSVIKYFYDHWNVKFFLTGSSSYYLRNLFPESLAGRKIIFELYPLTFGEFLEFHDIHRVSPLSWKQKAKQKTHIAHETLASYYKEYMEYGGFPSVVLEPTIARKRVLLSEIFTSYFEKDAKQLADFHDMAKLRDLILLLVPRIGQRLDITKLASELALSRQTVYSYLTFLEQTYFITLLPKYSKSIDRQAAGGKKLFFCDTGVAIALGRLSDGQVFEQSVFECLRPKHILSYSAKSQTQEIDFIVDNHTALEVKTHASNRDIATLHGRSAGQGIQKYFVITQNYSTLAHVIPSTSL